MATEQQQDLLGDDSYSEELLDHLESVPAEVREKWPKDLAALCDIYDSELKRLGITDEDAHRIALSLLLAQANYGGGRMYYMPKGDRLKQAVRDRQIYREFNGRNHDELGKRYGLTVQRIYEIVKRQGEIERARVQPRLF